MNSINSHIPSTSPSKDTGGGGTDNYCYTQSFTDIPKSKPNEDRRYNVNIPVHASSASPTPFPVIFEIPTDTVDSVRSTGPSPSPCSSGSNHHQHRRSTGNAPIERQLSQLDPMSERVSTILVWQNLTVQIREDKKKEAFRRTKSYKTFVPKRKSILNNISGTITGGLWAVMGKFCLSKERYNRSKNIPRSFEFG